MAVQQTTVNPDLAVERQNATFNAEELTYFLYNGPEWTKRKRYLQNLAIQGVAKLKLKQYATLSREEQYESGLQKGAYAITMVKKLGLKSPAERMLFTEAVNPHEATGFNLHNSMFTDTINRLASDEQKEKWLPLVQSFRMVGTYAQTELGHGTFLRGLETTATYDPQTKEFILNSPTISSIKYWPGGLGKTANCCVVMAQLISNGQNHGMQSFMVQIRDYDTHEPLPGVTVGDIGNKFGYAGIDNGFLRLNNVRIPRENMLMRYAKVLENGTFVHPKSDRLVYGTMTMVRSAIVHDAGRGLAKAATIAVRYSAVRKQSEIQPGAGEVKVLDFQTQQQKVLPQVAAAYALMFTGRNVLAFYMQVTSQIEKGALEELPQLHALSAGLKAVSSWDATNGIEACRLACGGHGYSQASGIPKIYVDVCPSCTYEGENTVMTLQTARYLIKCYNQLRQGEQLPSLIRFLQSPLEGRSSLDNQLELQELLAAFEHRARRMVHEVGQKLQTAAEEGKKSHEAWNSNSVELSAAAVAFAQAYIVKVFTDTVSRMEGKVKAVMTSLCQLYALDGIIRYLGDFMKDGYISSEQAVLLQSQLLTLLAELRPNAVALVDAFDFPDAVLDSALGRWDGNVYEALYDYSLRSKLNEKQVLDAYHKYQRPFMESQWKNCPQAAVTSRL
ncbi:peroxisomal acyl-coenzyme A oxidase 1-like [Pomacea canaliculata]|uniref:peroxisomal acyl-coenzyme A oxidase 1-like n=1 Tax=Pomacea canaliculata TaxID=400727 RepID=UPI000D73F4F8|nr:peroxisomal acyl-coenzyme A oxidase 1-like [Pomacea canaliculata]